ncbi:MAG TPA: PaaX family transcriptional regulator C-terminal domain-containing protein [Candidatus Woesebacteria bacterium]|nr:PaaX family transcriptional regulator C-terminal domain-containing protein [Candidatus Woesebacteria bacterium]
MSIKDRRTKILLSLLLLSDKEFKSISYDSATLHIFDLTMNRKTIATFKKLVKDGFVTEDESKTDLPTYKLTTKGFHEITLSFPVFRFSKEDWDGVWRILSYEIPEKKRELRDRLRRQVSSWGLGPWHRSFWLTPHPIIPWLKDLISQEEKAYVQAFESKHVLGDQDILIEKVWATSQLEKKYRKLFMKWHDVLSKDEDKIKKMKLIIDDYIEIIKTDPGLPKELIGSKWIGFEAINLFKEIQTILLSSKDS